MSDSTMGRHAAQAAGWSRFRAGVVHFITWVRAEHRVRHDLAELRAADDRLLADIGLARGQIDHAVRHGRWCDSADSNVLP
ncbi:DUF1127 domain-containing protein [Inquilinus sp. CA228]|uniref:DUF1127 domain-containing protein n=1 Tax=Inquilinus sp. CA228 TaxID=3455609 RepID=UPI003F8D3B54